MRFVVAPFVAAGLLFAAPMARAQVDSREGIALQNQIYQLRQELKSLEDQVARGGGGSGYRQPSYAPPQSGGNDLVAQLLTRVDALEDQVRELRGRVDETDNQLQRQAADLGKRIDDLAFQVNPQGARPSAPQLAPTSPQSPPPTNLASPPPERPALAPVPRTPERALQEGNAALARHDYAAAEAAAREVLTNRTSPRAYDAQYLLAQALAGERQYPQAAVAFDDVFNRARTGSHAQDARLGLASSLAAINEKKAACDVLARMPSEFPHLRADVSAKINAASQRAGCR